VLAPIPLSADSMRADAVIPLPVTRSGWFTLRAWSRGAREPVLDIYPFATTSPIYVTVGGRPVRNARDAEYFARWIERLEAAARAHTGWNDATERSEVLERLGRARAVYLARMAPAGN
jgi:TolB protein